ncbi:MAG: SDR family oxidoreductase [Acidobacteriota bacterium]
MRAKPLVDRVAVVTGVSRRLGIAASTVTELLEAGAAVYATGWPNHDAEQPWGLADGETQELLEEWAATGEIHWEASDLAEAEAPRTIVNAARQRFGAVDFVAAVHARSSHQALAEVTAAELDACWATNARSCVLLAQAFAELFDAERGHGALVLFTSGQHIGPMSDEIAYAVSKGAIHQMTHSLSDALIDRGITVNCVNPGPVDTGWLDGELHEQVASMFPSGRWGQPADIARIVRWLCTQDAAWLTGQILDAEGGFRRWASLDRFD